MPLQRTELYPFFQKHSIPTEAHFKELIDSMLNLEDDGVSKPPDAPLSIKAVGTEEGLMNFYRDNGGVNESTWQFKQKPGGKAGLSIHDVAADATPSRLFIESGTGNVGIGTTEPGEMLEVAGLIKAEGVTFPDGTEQTTAATSGLWTQNGLNIYYDAGNVGIGTTEPETNLHIEGGTDASLSSGGYLMLGSKTGENLLIDNNEILARKNGSASTLWIQKESGDTVMGLQGGNVGIGTTTTYEKLTVDGRMSFVDGDRVWSLGASLPDGTSASNDAETGASVAATFAIRDRWEKRDRLVIDAAGNVGIGTTTPGAKLEVKGGVTILEQEAWQTPAFQNGWVNFSTSYNTAGYFKDSQGVVHLKGLVKSGKASTTIFTLPAGYRPAGRELHVVCTSPDVSGRVDVYTDGQVHMNAGSVSWISLDGITFRAK